MQLFHFGASRQFPAAAAKTIWSMISACTLQVSLLFPDTDLSILSMAHHYLWNWMELFSVILWRGVTFLISIFHISSFRDRLPLINCWRFLFVLFLFCFVIVIIFFFTSLFYPVQYWRQKDLDCLLPVQTKAVWVEWAFLLPSFPPTQMMIIYSNLQ